MSIGAVAIARKAVILMVHTLIYDLEVVVDALQNIRICRCDGGASTYLLHDRAGEHTPAQQNGRFQTVEVADAGPPQISQPSLARAG